MRRLLARWRHASRALQVVHHPDYRVPLPHLEATVGMDPRRAERAAWSLAAAGLLEADALHAPPLASFEELERVHPVGWLERIATPEGLARALALDPAEVVVDALLGLFRRATGGTVLAARLALDRAGPVLNLLGGFHHARREGGGGFCVLDDVAVALAALRAEGFGGRAVVIDLDAHPPDGIADCLAGDPAAWIGSLSGTDWGGLPGVDETVLPPGTGGEAYLAALRDLLDRMPEPGIAFVLAGGDVLAGDRQGALGLTLQEARLRDRAVARRLAGAPSVWLPAGGYHPAAWRLLAGTGMVLAADSLDPVPEAPDPLRHRYRAIAERLAPELLDGGPRLSEADLVEALGERFGAPPRLLGHYTTSGVELALVHYGFLRELTRLGYAAPRVLLDRHELGDRLRILGRWQGREHLLVELVVSREVQEDLAGQLHPVVYVHWLLMRHPRARGEPALPGQDTPGLGLGREAGELLLRMVERLGLEGLVQRPSWYHVAWAARDTMAFVDPARQGRFLSLVEALADLPLAQASALVHAGRMRLDGRPYTWEPDPMAAWRVQVPTAPERVEAERRRCRWTREAG